MLGVAVFNQDGYEVGLYTHPRRFGGDSIQESLRNKGWKACGRGDSSCILLEAASPQRIKVGNLSNPVLVVFVKGLRNLNI